MADLLPVTKAIYDRLVANAPLIADLPKYGGKPAVFSGFLVPPDAPMPRVVISTEPVSDVSEDDVTAFLREQTRDVFVYAARGKAGVGSENPIDRIAENVRSALHLFFLPLAGWTTILAHASGPLNAPTDETVVGRVIAVRYLFSEA